MLFIVIAVVLVKLCIFVTKKKVDGRFEVMKSVNLEM